MKGREKKEGREGGREGGKKGISDFWVLGLSN